MTAMTSPSLHLVVGRDPDLGDGAGDRRLDRDLHLHRLEDGEVSPSATVWPTSTCTCHTLAVISATTSTTSALLSAMGTRTGAD